MPNESDRSSDRSSVNRLRHLALGSELAGGVLVPVLVGLWLDSRFDRSPLFILIGTFLGLFALTATLLRVLKDRSSG